MPESKPRESQASSPAKDEYGGSSNGDSGAPSPADNSEQKRRLFQQWVASVRPKAPAGQPSGVSLPQASRVPIVGESAPIPATATPLDDREASPEISVNSSAPPRAPSSHPPATTHAVSSPPPSVFPAFSPQQESDSTQLYQKVPADLLRKARESHLSTAPPPPNTNAASTSQLREDPWATADERTAVFAPPPELLASVRAAAASAGLLPSDGPASEPAPSGRITAEFDVAGQATASPAPSEAPEVTKVAPPPSEVTETPVTPSVRESSAGSDEQHEHEREDGFAERRRWPWAVAALLIAAGLAGLAVRSQLQEPNRSPVHAPSR